MLELSAIAYILLSARLHIVLQICAIDAASVPPGRINVFCGGMIPKILSISFSIVLTMCSSITVDLRKTDLDWSVAR